MQVQVLFPAPIEIIRTQFLSEARSDDFFPCRQTPYFPIALPAAAAWLPNSKYLC
jgi:hypothetical protein